MLWLYTCAMKAFELVPNNEFDIRCFQSLNIFGDIEF